MQGIKPQYSTQATNLLFKRDPNSYILTPEEAKKVVIKPASAYGLTEGYQRPQKKKKINDMVMDLNTAPANSPPYGPIYLVLNNGVLECVDGQHRLMAHIEADQPVHCFIFNTDNSGAREIFVRDNGNSTKSSNIENSRASNSVKSVFLYQLENKFEISRNQTMALMTGLCAASGGVGKFGRDDKFTIEQEDAANMILEIWTASDLWKFVEKGVNVKISASGKRQPYAPIDAYSSKTVLEALGRLVRDRKYDIKVCKKLVNIIKSSDWSKTTGRSFRMLSTETSRIGARLMLDFIKADVLANQV